MVRDGLIGSRWGLRECLTKTEKTSFGCVRGLTPLVAINGFVFR